MIESMLASNVNSAASFNSKLPCAKVSVGTYRPGFLRVSDIVAVTLGAIATQRSCCPNPVNHNLGSAVQVVLVRRRLSVFLCTSTEF